MIREEHHTDTETESVPSAHLGKISFVLFFFFLLLLEPAVCMARNSPAVAPAAGQQTRGVIWHTELRSQLETF